MTAKKTKFYVVWKGAMPGIYETWRQASAQVTGYPGALFKSFPSRYEAELAFDRQPTLDFKLAEHSQMRRATEAEPASPDLNGLAVDASCLGAPGPVEYRGVWLLTAQQEFRIGPYQGATNNVGEFLAIVHAAAILKYAEKLDVTIYSDSLTALDWVRARECRTKLLPSNQNQRIFELIGRAVNWLKLNSVENPLLKWDTPNWGENPADFGRK